jgi:hypothetical protein
MKRNAGATNILSRLSTADLVQPTHQFTGLHSFEDQRKVCLAAKNTRRPRHGNTRDNDKPNEITQDALEPHLFRTECARTILWPRILGGADLETAGGGETTMLSPNAVNNSCSL